MLKDRLVTIRVLHVTSSLGGGGVAQMLVNYSMHLDPREVTSDFVVHGDKECIHEQYFLDAGSKIFHAPPKKSAPIRNFFYLLKVISTGDYDVVHAHQNFSNIVPLIISKLLRVPIRISHGHGFPTAPKIFQFIARLGIQKSATDFFACTSEVGKWLHPSKWDNPDSRTFIMQNAIDLNRFSFSSSARANWRQKLQLGNAPTLIQVGRLSKEKNYQFTISLLHNLIKISDWKLLIVGDGPLESTLMEKVNDLGLAKSVIFMGYQKDIAGLLSAADVFMMPSISEGLGMAAVEAQASGISVLASDRLTEDIVLSPNIELLPLDIMTWASKLRDTFNTNTLGRSQIDKRLETFMIEIAAPKYVEYLMNAQSQSSSAH